MQAQFTVNSILEFLDNCVISEPCWFFMDLEHGYFYTANSRLTLYADDTRWAIVFEKSGHANRGYRIELETNSFGNCLHSLEPAGLNGQFTHNAQWIALVDSDALEEIESDYGAISATATTVCLRGEGAKIPPTKEAYSKWVPDIRGDPHLSRPNFADLGRFLAFEYADICRATDAEKRRYIPQDLPQIMMVDEWHHRSYSRGPDGLDGDKIWGEAPSSYETFPLLADALVTGDPSRFRPTLPPNNHWENWPYAGIL